MIRKNKNMDDKKSREKLYKRTIWKPMLLSFLNIQSSVKVFPSKWQKDPIILKRDSSKRAKEILENIG